MLGIVLYAISLSMVGQSCSLIGIVFSFTLCAVVAAIAVVLTCLGRLLIRRRLIWSIVLVLILTFAMVQIINLILIIGYPLKILVVHIVLSLSAFRVGCSTVSPRFSPLLLPPIAISRPVAFPIPTQLTSQFLPLSESKAHFPVRPHCSHRGTQQLSTISEHPLRQSPT